MLDGYPIWHNWPFGEQGHNVNDKLECPVCWNPLRAVKHNLTFNDGTEIWTVICPHCRTQYVYGTQAGKLTEQSIDPRDDEIALLRRQLRYLYERIQELQAQQQYPPARPPRVVHEQENHDADHNEDSPDDDDFTTKYRYLMS